MSSDELDAIAWLADWGLRFWIFDNYTRNHQRLTKERAERYTTLLDAFERKIVPNLMTETEEAKQRRFEAHEDRMKNMWEAYPA